jgi:hypothetical protein
MLVHLRYFRSEHLGIRDVVRLSDAHIIIMNHRYFPCGFMVLRNGFRVANQSQDCHFKKCELTLQEIMRALGKLETFIRNYEMKGKATSRCTLDYFPRNRAWKDESWKGCWRMRRFEQAQER